MKIADKIMHDLQELKKWLEEIRKPDKKIVVCQGHFNVIHPGHLRFLEFAKKHGDYLLVAVLGEKKLDPVVKNKFFNTDERTRGVASLEYVDKVIIVNDISLEQIIDAARPDFYVLGEEFSKKMDRMKNEINQVERYGGKVIFSSGDAHYATSEFLDKDLIDIKEERKRLFIKALLRQNIQVENLRKYLDNFPRARLLVIGDTIVDQYVACDALGMSSEAPVLVVQELENKEYIGGAAIVAMHVHAMGAQCFFISVLGDDGPGTFIKQAFAKQKIDSRFLVDMDRPTTFKIRYMVEQQKILRVSRLLDQHLNQKMEKNVIDSLNAVSSQLDGIIVSDFGYGMITPVILDHIADLSQKYNLKLFGDSQSSSQIGNVAKFKNYFLIKPTEKEARMALDDKYSGLELIGNNLIKKIGAKNIVLTLGVNGLISFQRTENEFFIKTQHFPALNPHPVDVVGAGDSLLTGLAVSLCSGADLMEASAIGSIIASIEVSKMGNIPVATDEVKRWLDTV